MDSNNQNLFDLQIDQPVNSYLTETAKWAKFLAIVGFVACGIFALIGIFAGSFMATTFGSVGGDSGMSAILVTLIYLGGAAIYFFPCLFLFHFANKMLKALRQNDQYFLTASFKNLKSCYKYMGILMIIILSLYAIIFIIFIVGMIAGASSNF